MNPRVVVSEGLHRFISPGLGLGPITCVLVTISNTSIGKAKSKSHHFQQFYMPSSPAPLTGEGRNCQHDLVKVKIAGRGEAFL